MNVVAFIPARGGSKRIPGKNMREVGGLSLVEHAITQAIDAGIERVVLSTDDPRIAHGHDYVGTEIHRRPAHLATDDAQIEDAIAHWAETGGDWDAMVLLQPTSPLRRPETIRRCLRAMPDGEGSAYATVCRRDVCHGRPGEPASYGLTDVDVGCVYAFTREHWEIERCRYATHSWEVPIDRFEAWEVDEPLDLVVVEALLAARDAT